MNCNKKRTDDTIHSSVLFLIVYQLDEHFTRLVRLQRVNNRFRVLVPLFFVERAHEKV